MLVLFSAAFITALLVLVIMVISSILAKKTILDREKMSPFECGFDPKGSARLPFSLRFFLIAIIFLIFDVEITLLLPLATTLKSSNIATITFSGIFFMVILLGGLYHEWNQGALNWND